MAATRKRSPKQKAWKIIQSQDNEVRNMLREREIVALRRKRPGDKQPDSESVVRQQPECGR